MNSVMKITAILFVLLLSTGSAMASLNQNAAEGTSVQPVRINEVMYNPVSPEVDGEWIEIFNGGDEAENVTGWVLTDQDGADDFVFPEMAIPSGCFVVIHAGTGNNSTDFGNGVANFYLFKGAAFLGNSGDDICLMNGSLVVDYVAYGNSTSIDRSPDGRDFSPLPLTEENSTLGIVNGTWSECVPTPGRTNSPVEDEEAPDSETAENTTAEDEVKSGEPTEPNETKEEPQYAPILITDVYYYSLLSEAFTIYNPADKEISLSGWSFSDGEGTVFFPDSATIAPSSYITLAQNVEGYFEESGIEADLNWSEMRHSGTFRMNNNGDELLLYCGSVQVDAYVYGDSEYNGTGWTGSPALPLHSTEVAHRALVNGTYADTNTSSDWDGSKSGIGRSSFPALHLKGRMNITAFSAPDNSYDVLAHAIDSAESSIVLNVYEFTSYPISSHLIEAARRGVNITLLLEGGPVGGLPEEEITLCQRMHSAGMDIRFMVNDYAEKINDRYRFDHAKYMVIDGSRLVIMSENIGSDGFSPAHTGNRGWGLVIDNASLAEYFSRVFAADSDSDMRDIASIEDMPFYTSDVGFYPHEVSAPTRVEPEHYSGNASITAVLSPDTSLSQDTVLGLIRAAEKSVYVEQFYIYKHWGSRYTGNVSRDPNPYLEAVIDAARRGCEVRVLLDSTWYNIDPNSSVDNDDTVEYINSIAESEGLDMEAKVISDCHNFTHLHNKGVIVDNRSVLVSSINWNENSVKENREAGLIVEAEPVASYFTSLFEEDWISEPHLSVSLNSGRIVRANESLLLAPVFTVSESSISNVVWTVGTASYESPVLNTSFSAPGTYNITVTVYDIYGRTAIASASVVVLPSLPAREANETAGHTGEQKGTGTDTTEERGRGLDSTSLSAAFLLLSATMAALILKGLKREGEGEKKEEEEVPQHS